jgi:hypothetical protein
MWKTFPILQTKSYSRAKSRLISRIYGRQQTTGNAALLMTEVVSTDILAFTYSANRSIYTMKYATLKNPYRTIKVLFVRKYWFLKFIINIVLNCNEIQIALVLIVSCNSVFVCFIEKSLSMLTNKFWFLNFFFNHYVKLIYSIQVLGPWLWGNRPFFFFSGGAEEGAQWGKCPTSPWY